MRPDVAVLRRPEQRGRRVDGARVGNPVAHPARLVVDGHRRRQRVPGRRLHRLPEGLGMTTRRRYGVAVAAAVLSLTTGMAWGYWTAGSQAGGGGAAAAMSVNQGSTPTATASGRSVT